MYGLIRLFSRLPLRLLYIFADVTAWLMEHVVKYRCRVITENLMKSFPELSEKEVSHIRHRYYGFLSDYFVETLKLATMSREEMLRRFTVANPEIVNQYLDEGKSCSVMLGHFCNWEWVSSLPLHFKAGATCAQLYHPLENRKADEIMSRLRTRWGANNIPMNEALRKLLSWKRDGIPTVTGYIADQSPTFNGMHLFVDFLNHPETPVFTGPEKISRKLRCAMIYARLSRPARGYYHCEFVPICDDASSEKEFDPTRRYYELLEEDITRSPQYWLWSHRRWKRSRSDFEREYSDVAAKRMEGLNNTSSQ